MGFLRLRVAIGLFLLASVACAGDGTGLDQDDGGDEVTLSRDVQPIFTGNCAFSGCHAGSNPEQGMNLGAGQAFSSVVNVAARELPSMNRVVFLIFLYASCVRPISSSLHRTSSW